MNKLHRRSVLRGTLGAGIVTVALPFLDCFLNNHGTALASGAPLPLRFGTWFWGLGLTPGRAISNKVGPDYEFLAQCQALVPFRKQINYFSGYRAPTDGRPNAPHYSGLFSIRSGASPAAFGDIPAPTLDVLIADAIGGGTRFRTLQIASTGNARDSYSARGNGGLNAAEGSPIELYKRVFGPEFVDPNNAKFEPDPRIMLRRSVLSAITERRHDVLKKIGTADRARIDEYFTSIRQLENQLDLQLQKPAPADACGIPASIDEAATGLEIGTVSANHQLMASILAMAVACNQTKIFNMVYSSSTSALRRPGESATHHVTTHEELIDKNLGYQPVSAWFAEKSMEALATFIKAFADISEGDGTLLDHTLLFAHSDTSYAKTHSIDDIPMMTIGAASGRLKTGLHVASRGDAITSVGLTLQKVMGLRVEKWGARSLETSKEVAEILA